MTRDEREDRLMTLLLRAVEQFKHIPQRNQVHVDELRALEAEAVALCGPQEVIDESQ